MNTPQILLLWAEVPASRVLSAGIWDGLSPEERTRCLAIADPVARQQFATGRGLLRKAYALARAGKALPALRINALGKPVLEDEGVDFSISHSERAVAVALSTGGRVGLDVEACRPLDPESVSAVLSPREWENLRSLPAVEAGRACLGLWTQKEAGAKLLGCPENLDVRLLPAVAGPDCRFKTWTLTLAEHTYHLCLAHEGEREILLQKESA